MTWTAEKVRDAVLNVMMGEIGNVSNSYVFSDYGKQDYWRSPWLAPGDWQGYYCNRFVGWSVDQVCGAEAGVLAVGRQSQSPLPVGFAATWLQREWYMRNNRHVGWANLQRGDSILYKKDGRVTSNPTNHIGTFLRWYDYRGGKAVVIHANLRHPSGEKGIGVHYHLDSLNHEVVSTYRPNWDAAAKKMNEIEERSKPKPKPPPPPTPAPAPEPSEPVERIPNMNQYRIAGANRYETMAEVAVATGRKKVYLVGAEFDALAAVNLGDGAVLLVRDGSDDVPKAVLDAIRVLKPTEVLSVGGSLRVTDQALYEVRKLAGLDV